MATVEQGLALRRRNPTQGPWGTMFHLLVSARVALEAGELPMARDLIEEISTRMDRFTEGMGPMRARLTALQEAMRLRADAPGAGEPLTGRELDVLRFLQRPLSLTEIADELYVSPNTVKTHTQALYRKLAVRSRTEAVRVGRQRSLI
jgi:DNA-binding NarL/FixJ family response regulator